ncbi:aquaporin-11-like [Xiphias gladius]|uniref:aquaporin-11-like n=1 Tax=Xiphias gladius TaxID=8245 RepID=UPI001A99262F|nr:aquaporin-11-like [Xiphias gladius]XP_040006515.1 aquaporin-11-like [Xiphias gladius]
MTDLAVSLAALGAAVLLSEATRRTAARLFPGAYGIYLLEAASTFQLCCCTHELKLLGETARLEPPVGLTLTYTMTVIHLLTFRGATCNPSGALEGVCRGTSTGRAAVVLIACQFAAALAAQFFAAAVWSLGLSDMHLRHRRFGFRCFDPLGGTVLEAAAVELACAFVVQAAAMHVHKVDERLRAHCVAAVITALVYTGGSISGAVFNPVLAFSIQFPCSGHTYLEYCFVYWLGPILGVASCILLFEKIIPFLSGKSTAGLDVPAVQKQKTQ